MIIGKFTRSGNAYTGKLVTLTKFEPAERGADYPVTMEGVEVGAAWKKTAKDTGKAYLSVKLDSPFLATPVNGAPMLLNSIKNSISKSMGRFHADCQQA
jgi:uncharacterized protein (DUF736 family)